MRDDLRCRIYALSCATALWCIAAVGWSQSIVWLGTLGGCCSEAYGVSNNAVVVGLARDTSARNRAFRWENGVMQNLGTLGGVQSRAFGVSADGSVVVGWAESASGYTRAFRWTQATGMQDIGTLGGTASWAWGVSADGAVIVGRARSNASERAFR